MNKVELLFGIGGGFKLILDEVKLKGGEFSKGAPIVYVKSGGILEMNGGAITEARVDEAVPSCVRIAGGGIFIMNGTVINGENAVGEGEINVAEGGTLVMNGGRANWVINNGTTKIGGDAVIRKFCSSMKPLEIFAPLTDEILRIVSHFFILVLMCWDKSWPSEWMDIRRPVPMLRDFMMSGKIWFRCENGKIVL